MKPITWPGGIYHFAAGFVIMALLTGCIGGQKLDVIVPVVQTKAKLQVADPAPMKLGKVKWIVVTEKNWDQVVAKIKGEGKIVVLYAVDGKNFKQIQVNEAEAVRYIRQVRSNVKAYKNYYE